MNRIATIPGITLITVLAVMAGPSIAGPVDDLLGSVGDIASDSLGGLGLDGLGDSTESLLDQVGTLSNGLGDPLVDDLQLTDLLGDGLRDALDPRGEYGAGRE